MEDALLILLAFLLIFLNAFFVCAEFGMVKLRATRVTSLRRTHGLRGYILSEVHSHLDAYLSACQIGITLTSIGLGWIGEPAVASLLEPIFISIGITSPDLVTIISFIVAFTIISFLHIVLGELVPKSLAIRQSERVSIWTAIPLYSFYWLMYPAIYILNMCSNFILKVAGLDATSKGDLSYAPEEIKLILHTSHLYGQFTKQETEILKHTIDFAELKVTDVMSSADEMIVVILEQPISESLKTIHQYRYSRYPVFSKEKNEIIGIIHVKDLFAKLYENIEVNNLETIMRPIVKVSRRMTAVKLLNKFRKGMPHFALIYTDIDTSPIGFVTLDHLFQVLVGRIRDEFHKTKDEWEVTEDGSYIMSGQTPYYAIERALDIDIELNEQDEEDIDTITGLILHQIERLPAVNEKIEFEQFTIVVLDKKGHRITRVAVYPKKSGTKRT